MSLNLNPEQLRAVNFSMGAAMVIAGAGCGKTRVITNRIRNLIETEKELPHKIVALTFTNKAAKEMMHRLEDVLQSSIVANPFIGTFHSYCFFLLKRYKNDFGLENFGILDTSDQTSLMKKILIKYGLEKEIPVKKALSIISSIKNGSLPTTFLEEQTKLGELFNVYESEKHQSYNLDFDDLLLKVYKKLESDPVFLEKISSKIDHILIDEYQDTNTLQHNLIKLLATGSLSKEKNNNALKIKSIFAVGDEDQSIYSWRGAIVENMNTFIEDFKPVTIIKIEQNYRSAQQILTAANHVIQNNQNRHHSKQLWSTDLQKNCLFIATCKNEYQEAELVAHSINTYLKTSPSKTCAILYRNHHQSRLIEEACIQNKIRYKIIGGIRFYERKEVKDLLAYLKLLNNPSDWISLDRIINCPNRGLGDKFIEKLDLLRSTNAFSNYQDLLNSNALDLSGEKQKNSIATFLEFFKTSPQTDNALEVFEHFLETTKYIDFLQKEYDPEEAETKIRNVEELRKSITNFVNTSVEYDNEPGSIQKFLEEIALIQETDVNLEANSHNATVIELMTLHSAKGLEFDKVIIVGCEDGSLPSIRKDNTHSLEEERRLLYVGITRARSKLMLTHAANKLEYGKITSYSQSRFINEIPKSLRIDNSQSQNTNLLKSEATGWLLNQQQSPLQNNMNINHSNHNIVSKLHTTTNHQPVDYKIGSLVKHEIFGYGSIKSTYIDKNETILEIFFKSGLKKIKAAFIKRV